MSACECGCGWARSERGPGASSSPARERREEVPTQVSSPLAVLPYPCTPTVHVFPCSKEKDRAKAPVKKKEDPSAIKEREV